MQDPCLSVGLYTSFLWHDFDLQATTDGNLFVFIFTLILLSSVIYGFVTENDQCHGSLFKRQLCSHWVSLLPPTVCIFISYCRIIWIETKSRWREVPLGTLTSRDLLQMTEVVIVQCDGLYFFRKLNIKKHRQCLLPPGRPKHASPSEYNIKGTRIPSKFQASLYWSVVFALLFPHTGSVSFVGCLCLDHPWPAPWMGGEEGHQGKNLLRQP